MLELFSFPFIQRACIAGICSGLVLGALGVFVTSRQMSFIGDGVAHASLAAIAFAVLFGLTPLPVALIFSILLGLLLYYLDSLAAVSRDVAIGILFTTFLSIGVILLQYHNGYVPELVTFLFGNILSVQQIDVFIICFCSIVILFLLTLFYRSFLFLTIDSEGAMLAGVSRRTMDICLYICTSVAVVLSVKVVGIILVTGLLVLPSAITKPWCRSFRQFFICSIITSACLVFGGLIASYLLDWPTGATIVLFGAFCFLCSRIFYFFRRFL